MQQFILPLGYSNKYKSSFLVTLLFGYAVTVLLSSCGREPQPQLSSSEINQEYLNEKNGAYGNSQGWLPLLSDAYRISKDYDKYTTEYETEHGHDGLSSDNMIETEETEGENDRAGFVVTQMGMGAALIRASKLQADGKLVVGGDGPNANTDFALTRYNTDGTLDTSFNTNGKVVSTISSGIDSLYSLQIQTDGKLIGAGKGSGSNTDFALARYNTDGTLDTSFKTTGKVTTSLLTSNDYIYTLQIQTDGKVVAGGPVNAATLDFGLARYNTDGALDTSFNTNGKLFLVLIHA